MTEACPARFHVFDAEGDLLSVDHVLLCAGVTVTGPGVLYRLQFQAGPDFAVTTLSLVDGTAFYEAGNPVFPVLTQNAQVRIGDLTDVPAPGAASALDLRASPNPFNPRTVFTFDLELAGPSRLAVYTLDGRLVRTLALGHLARGRHEYAWDGTTDAGRPAEAGVYCARLEVLGQRAFRTITLVK